MFKKTVCLVAVLVLIFTLFGCEKEAEGKDGTNNSASSQVEKVTDIDKAKALIEEGKCEEAYTLLYSLKDNTEASQMLKDFLVVYKERRSVFDNEEETEFYTYDKNGNVIKISNSDGQVLRENTFNGNSLISQRVYYENGETEFSEYEYDKEGRPIKRYFTDGSGKRYLSVERTYNSLGKAATEKGEEYKRVYSYDKNGNLTKEVTTSEGETFTTEYVYDSQNRIIKETYYDAYSTGPSVTEHMFDENGNEIRSIYTDDLGEKTDTVMEYDNNNRLIRQKTEGKHVYYEELYTYDAKGRQIKYVTLNADGVVSTTVTTYDDVKNTQTSKTTSEGDTVSEELTYDKNGNWLKRVYIDGESDINFIEEFSGYMYFYRPDLKNPEYEDFFNAFYEGC